MRKLDGKLLFTLLITAFVCLLLHQTVNLSPVSRLVPLAILVPTLGLLILQIVLDLTPGLEKGFGGLGRVNLFGVRRVRENVTPRGDNDEASSPDERLHSRRELNLVLWLSSLLISIYLFGLLLALPAYTLIYLRRRSGETWTLSLASAGVIFVLLYGVFALALGVRLYEGLLWSLVNL